ncbi:MAG: universal stress protein [Candidatus Brocadiaceae bacterium]|nr:universal stress protein [Candidatus Brocadiaceae bacterium]
MITLKNILCPIDYSIYSEIALKYAIEFAERYRAKLFLIHVLDSRSYDVDDLEIHGTEITDKEAIDSLKTKLLTCVNEETKNKITVEAIVLYGVPFSEIITASKKYQIDLIVLGTHGRTGLVHAIMGSVAEKVIRKATCPVITIRHPEREFIMP